MGTLFSLGIADDDKVTQQSTSSTTVSQGSQNPQIDTNVHKCFPLQLPSILFNWSIFLGLLLVSKRWHTPGGQFLQERCTFPRRLKTFKSLKSRKVYTSHCGTERALTRFGSSCSAILMASLTRVTTTSASSNCSSSCITCTSDSISNNENKAECSVVSCRQTVAPADGQDMQVIDDMQGRCCDIVYDPEYTTGLPERSSNLADCNFIIRMLYLNTYWLNNGLFMLLVWYVLLYVVALCVKMRYVILSIKRLLLLLGRPGQWSFSVRGGRSQQILHTSK